MNDLLNLAVEAHGGLKRSRQTGSQSNQNPGIWMKVATIRVPHFRANVLETAWDNLHVAYSSSYPLWNYLTIPFLYTYPGFVAEELPTWQEDGEYWREKRKIPIPYSSQSISARSSSAENV